MSEEATTPAEGAKMKYPVPVADAFSQGAVLGLAVRFATNVIAGDLAAAYVTALLDMDAQYAAPEKAAKAVAAFALAVGEELIKLGEEKGLVTDVPRLADGDPLPDDVMAHARLVAIYGSEQNVIGQYYLLKRAAEKDPRLAAVMAAAEDEARKAQGQTPSGLMIGRPDVVVGRKKS